MDGAWTRFDGTLSFIPDPTNPAKRITFELKEIEVRSLGTKSIKGVEYRWLEVEMRIDDYREIGRVFVNEKRYGKHRRLEIASGWVQHGLKNSERVVEFDPDKDLMADALKILKGGHFREEFQTDNNEARRDDENYAYASAWEYLGEDKPPKLRKEFLHFEHVHLTQRSYK